MGLGDTEQLLPVPKAKAKVSEVPAFTYISGLFQKRKRQVCGDVALGLLGFRLFVFFNNLASYASM